MDPFVFVVLFVFGLAIGSFVNVLALRYDGEHFLFDPRVIGGRSHCPHCKHTLRWYELVPVISFVVQRARCRNCGARIGSQYPLVELLSGFIFALVPFSLQGAPVVLPTLWVIAFEILLLIAYVDIRLRIVPDELNIFLGIAGIFIAVFTVGYFGMANVSLFGAYAGIFGLQNNFWIAHLAGALAGAAFFWLLAFVSPFVFKQEGMGMGDVKLALPLGFLFGWPDILLLYGAAFVIGALAGIAMIIARKKAMKQTLPFAPFLVAGAAIAFFLGTPLVGWYFRIIGL
ncbi:MAG TPA: prepilin peptidase [Candidatus Paceibacterota bacterium]|jgi:prepilin signal peptidase PulO-like enzyme (type II secretory pathway)|nr:prepilin peptidase [Candidatus Paceibacterota bacterium]